MAKNYKIYWYQEEQEVHDAFLCNCRDDDIRAGAGIPVGAIVLGAGGCVAAERAVRGYTGRIINFQPTCRCEWQGQELRCQVHPGMPAGTKLKAELRPFNHIVAELTSAEHVSLAKKSVQFAHRPGLVPDKTLRQPRPRRSILNVVERQFA